MDPVKLKAMVRDDTWRSCSARSKNPAAVGALRGLFDLIIETLAPGDLAHTLQEAKKARKFVEELVAVRGDSTP